MKKIRLLTLAVAMLLLLSFTATAASPLSSLTQDVIKAIHNVASEECDVPPQIFFWVLPEEGALLYAALPATAATGNTPSFLFANSDFGILYPLETLEDAVMILDVAKGMFDDFTPNDITIYYYNGETKLFL